MAKNCPHCHKRAHRTWRAAIRAALSASRRQGAGMRVYSCPVGGGLHLTSQPKRDKAAA